MDYKIQIGDILTLIAVLLSAYAVLTTSRFNRRQLSLIKTQEELNKLLLEQGHTEAQALLKADVGANFVKIGRGAYRLKIFNKGKSVAKNVRIEFPDGDDPLPLDELNSKFPMETLECHQSVDLVVAVHFETKMKHKIRLMWEDEISTDNEKTSFLTL